LPRPPVPSFPRRPLPAPNSVSARFLRPFAIDAGSTRSLFRGNPGFETPPPPVKPKRKSRRRSRRGTRRVR
jgi:hypothetical protein